LEESFRNDYLKDASGRIETIRETVNNLLFASASERTPALQAVLRESHAVKSGAGFYGLTDVETAAHALEDLAARYLKDQTVEGDYSDLMAGIGLLSAAFYLPRGSGPEGDDKQQSLIVSDRTLVDAWRRGEHFYRVDCQIDNEEPMPYARAFLLQSQLEARFTLHRSFPALTGNELPADGGREYRRLLFLLSSRLESGEILKAVNRDRVTGTGIVLLDFAEARELLAGGGLPETSAAETVSESGIPVPETTLDELKSLARELRSRIGGIRAGLSTPEDLVILADRMEITLEEVRSVRAARLFGEFPPWARDLAAGRGKHLHMEITGGQFYLNRALSPLILDILRQLVRNTVAHGLESPDERIEAGKPGTGLAVLGLAREKGLVTLEYHDDGRGFDETQLQPGETLKDRLTRSGFSTAGTADLTAGRGVGLDFVARTVTDQLGGILEFRNDPGSGFTVLISFPDRESHFSLFLFRYRDEVYGLPGKNIEDFYPIDRKKLKMNRNSGICYGLYQDRYYPLYSLNIPCRNPDSLSGSSSLIVLRHWGRRVLLPADELVLKEDFPEGEIVIGEPVKPHVYRVEPRPGLPGFLYLSPALAG
jgi:signal transduction histidine kinase